MFNSETEFIAIDTETTGLEKKDHPFAVSLCDQWGETKLYEWDVDPYSRVPNVDPIDLMEIMQICEGKQFIFFNQVFDLHKLAKVGIDLDWRGNSWEVNVLLHIIDSQTRTLYKRLKPLSKFYLEIDDDDEKELKKARDSARRIGKKLKWNNHESPDADYWMVMAAYKYYRRQYPLDEKMIEKTEGWDKILSKYANLDTVRTMGLFVLCQSIMEDWEKDDPRHKIVERERRLTTIVHDLKNRGLAFFPRKAKSEIDRYQGILDEQLDIIADIAGDDFNIESGDQKSKLLFEDWGFEPVKYTKSSTVDNPKYSTDKDVRSELFELVQDYPKEDQERRFIESWDRYASKTTFIKYLKAYIKSSVGDVLYPTLNQVGTATTRFSSNDPNGQNVMKGEVDKDGNIVVEGLRHVFGPKPGRKWFCLDYSQLQLRIFAWYAGEDSMIEAFEKGYDFHSFIASKIFDKHPDEVTKLERRIGKNCNFGFIFGASPSKIEQTAGIKGLWNLLLDKFPSAHKFMEKTKLEVRKRKYITTAFNYRLQVDKAHKGVNYKVQGTEGDLVKEAMLACDDYLQSIQTKNFDGKLVFQVHDELIFDFPENYKREKTVVNTLKHLMEEPSKPLNLVTPVDVEYTTKNWGAVKSYV